MKRHLPMESDTDSTTSQSSISSRLGVCEVCNNKDAKYTCPKCEVKTCCLPCLQIHKRELNCDGIRDKTKYIPIQKMTKMDFLSDYNFLEECTRYVEDRKRDKLKSYTRYNKSLPARLFKLRNAANERGTTLRFLVQHFTRHNINTTFLHNKSKVIYWRVEWIFTNASNLAFTDERCADSEKLSKLLDKYLNPDCDQDVPMKKQLEYYQSKGIGNLRILLKSEGIKRCKNRFFTLDGRKTLRENLAGKTIVEFPCIHVCFDDYINEFDIIDSDEDVETETKEYRKMLDESYKSKYHEQKKSSIIKTDDDIEKELEKLNIEKKREERRLKREQMEKQPKNFLFTDEKLWDLFSSDSDGHVTEEEIS